MTDTGNNDIRLEGKENELDGFLSKKDRMDLMKSFKEFNKKKEKYPLTDLSKILKYIPYYFQLTSNKIRKQMIKEYFLN